MSNSKIIVGAILIFLLALAACTPPDTTEIDKAAQVASEKLFVSTMQKHLDAVTNRDLATLESTLSPEGNMQLILPSTEVTGSVEEFVDYHREWFADSTADWTFETKILNTEIGRDMGIAVTEIIYREPERNGKPYFNRMNVSYGLKKIENQWYIIKDHASSIEKTKS